MKHVIPLHAYICTSTFLQVLLSTVGLFRDPGVAFGSPVNPVGLRRVTNPSESPHASTSRSRGSQNSHFRSQFFAWEGSRRLEMDGMEPGINQSEFTGMSRSTPGTTTVLTHIRCARSPFRACQVWHMRHNGRSASSITT